jgi:PAS domain S-box-containing protein
MSQRTVRLRILAVGVLTFAAMFAFELSKEAVVPPNLTRWQSHWITIVFATIVAGLAAAMGFHAYEREAEERRRAEAAREAAVRELESTLRQTQGMAANIGRSEEMFSKIFRASPALMVIARLEEKGIVDANDAALAASGFTREELIGRSTAELGIWDIATRDAWLAKLRAEGRVRNALTEFTTPRGRRSMLLSGEFVDVGGETLVLAMAHDVTERLAAEHALRESEDRLRRSEEMFSKVFRACPAAMTIVERESGTIIDLNDAFLRARGVTREEMIGRTSIEARVWQNAAQRAAFVDLMNREGRVRDFPAEVPTRAGKTLSVLVSAEGVDIGGKACVVSMSRDVTEWLQSEQRLKDSEERLRLALTAARMGVWDWNAETDTIGWSDRENEVCGFAPGTAIRTFDDYIALTHPDDVEKLKQCVAETRAGRQAPYKNEHRVLQPDGSQRWVESRGQGILDAHGRALRLVGTIADMSERKQMEEALRRQQTLASIGSLVAGVAHEVRTPLFSISATIDAFEGGTPGEIEEGTQLLRAQVKRLSNLMSDLLEFGRPAGLQMERGGLDEIVRRAVAQCGTLASEAGVTVRPVLPKDPLVLNRDARRLEQAFQNLVANAIQHAPKGTEVKVVADAFRRQAHDFVECRVEDSGPGIPAESLTRVFEPFYSRRKGGTGLGLSIVQRIVEAHGGTVTAANRPAGGAAFTVILPASA